MAKKVILKIDKKEIEIYLSNVVWEKIEARARQWDMSPMAALQVALKEGVNEFLENEAKLDEIRVEGTKGWN